MNYYSTNNKNHKVGFSEAVMNGIAPDGGLYFPEKYPQLDPSWFTSSESRSISETAESILENVATDIPKDVLKEIVQKTFRFDAPLIRLDDRLHVLELFHGPTLAFKDFGARFLANTISFLTAEEKKKTVILVATSGDTGSAVGRGFLNMDGIKVGLLYPSGKVSRIQEQQLTTMGNNVQAFEVEGNFDDCQRLVKQAFMETDLKKYFHLSSANSINIARLLPQAVYYFRGYAQLKERSQPPVIIVPSGNFGNLTAGLLAWKMGLPVSRFVAAVNRNAVFPDYLQTGNYTPRPAFKTYSNAMDVGDPSNFVRIMEIFDNDHDAISRFLLSISIDDDETLDGIQHCRQQTGYTLDPHGAVGYQAYRHLKDHWEADQPVILLETAHPAKFGDIVEKAIEDKINVPKRLAACLNQPKRTIPVSSEFNDFKDKLLQVFGG